jgi:predicted transcriptional regulator
MGNIPEDSLGELEHAVLRHVWANGPCSADDCRQALLPVRALKDSTIRTVLRRLEEKGFVRHTTEGRTFLYQAAERPNHLAARAVKGIVDRFCGGSLEQLLVGMVDSKVLSRGELERLAKKIAQVKGGAK